MKYSELKKILKRYGCYKHGEGGNHEIWINPKTNKKFPVSRHNNGDVPIGTYNAIIKQSNIKEQE